MSENKRINLLISRPSIRWAESQVATGKSNNINFWGSSKQYIQCMLGNDFSRYGNIFWLLNIGCFVYNFVSDIWGWGRFFLFPDE